jgi:Zn-dependent oligopeptidase
MTLSNYNIYVIDECTKVTLDFLFQKAQILGFPTHSSFVLDMRMAKTAEAEVLPRTTGFKILKI